jgi:hypothetical protein
MSDMAFKEKFGVSKISNAPIFRVDGDVGEQEVSTFILSRN